MEVQHPHDLPKALEKKFWQDIIAGLPAPPPAESVSPSPSRSPRSRPPRRPSAPHPAIAPIQWAAGLSLEPFVGELAQQGKVAVPLGRLDQCQVEDVALRVAATEAVETAADRAQQADTGRVVAAPEGPERRAERIADLPGHSGVAAGCRQWPAAGQPASSSTAPSRPAATKAIMAWASLKA